MLSLAFGLAAAALAYDRRYFSALLAWLLNRLADGLDGSLSRVHGRGTDFGGYLDILADLVVYAAVPIGLVLGSSPTRLSLLSLVALLAAYYVNVASWMYLSAIQERNGRGASALGEQTAVTMSPGLIEGTETVLFYILFLVMPSRAAQLFLLMTALLMVTILQRVAWAWRHLPTPRPD